MKNMLQRAFFTVRIPFSLTLFGRSLLLISLEIVANAICWAFAARSHAILPLAILAWTIGLRHALDADHISAIDNATRTIINHGRLAITCGLFFSLGHSTIVIVVNVAIVISTGIYNKLDGFGNVGSIVGPAISGSFLFIVALANSFILCRILRQRRQTRRKRDSEHGETNPEYGQSQNMLMMRLLGPLVNFVNRPWKMYPVGVLFGLGFDTASSIALLAISALAKGGRNDVHVAPADVIVLPLLFTTGMTLVDSLDSILMLYSYIGFAQHSWKVFERASPPLRAGDTRSADTFSTHKAGFARSNGADITGPSRDGPEEESKVTDNAIHNSSGNAMEREHEDQVVLVTRSTLSQLSIILTAISILLAFSISLIEIMGLIGANCGPCQTAASASGGGGLAGAWWRAWAVANENYGYIGAGIVGVFVVLIGVWYTCRWVRLARVLVYCYK